VPADALERRIVSWPLRMPKRARKAGSGLDDRWRATADGGGKSGGKRVSGDNR
jgi:hypothetical protein